MRITRVMFLFLAAAALGACATDTATRMSGSAPRDAILPEAEPVGVLIFGVPRSGFLGFLVGNASREVHTVEFHAYDPVSNRLIAPEDGGRVFRLSRGGTAVDLVDEVDEIQYIVQPLPAGNYYLTAVGWGDHGQSMISKGSIAVEIVPGTAIYPGNIEFITPMFVFQEVWLRVRERNEEVARGFLAQYPNLAVEIRSVMPRVFALDCDLSQGRDACYAP